MGQPAAKQGDRIVAVDTHMVVPATGASALLPNPFDGLLTDGLSSNVNIMGMPAATVDSVANNTLPHMPPPGAAFQKAPSNKGTVTLGSLTVKINGKMAARNGDMAMTCNDPTDMPAGKVIAAGTVIVG